MKNTTRLLVFILCILVYFNVNGQLTAPGSSAAVPTQYPSFPVADNIYVFCAAEEGGQPATLQVQTALPGTKTFLWEKYNPANATFEFIFSESSEELQSVLPGLEDGGYRVTVRQGEAEDIHRAWVFNNFLTAGATVSESECESFTLQGEFNSKPLVYYDLANNTQIDLFKDIRIEWLRGGTVIGGVLEQEVFNPPAEDTEYMLRVFDRFGCEATASVMYEAISPRAAFTANPMQGEAPLTVTFNNLSVNADPNLFEWFIYRDLDEIKRESENTQQPVDSIMDIREVQNLEYTFNNSGTYKVKLVAKRSSEFQTCTDTAYLDGFIRVDTSFIAVPNVFTPNGDGDNDLFVVKFWSMQSIKISIFNRWGKRIHFWENNNVLGFNESFSAAVWDGRVGGRFASPGVYYYVVEGQGRDNKTRNANGFFHLFRGKD